MVNNPTPKAPKPISEYTAEEKKALNRMANPEMTDEEFDVHWEQVQKNLEDMKNGTFGRPEEPTDGA